MAIREFQIRVDGVKLGSIHAESFYEAAQSVMKVLGIQSAETIGIGTYLRQDPAPSHFYERVFQKCTLVNAELAYEAVCSAKFL